MGRITLEQAAQWCGGKIDPKYAENTFFGANNDSRKLEEGELFVALAGARDGHEFIPMAIERKAGAVLCTHCDQDYPAILVDDPRRALGDIARGARKNMRAKVVGVTGSVGKSTTKEMIAAVLGTTYRTAKSPANHNNDLGLPMSILAMPDDTEVAVLEMGMNHFREMAYLTSIAQPDVAVLLNIGTMHIEHLGSMEGILQAKLEILEGMKDNGVVVMNGDDPLLWNSQKKIPLPAIYFGEANSECDIRAEDVTEKNGVLTFRVAGEDQNFNVELSLEGRHFVLDAMAAVAVGVRMGVPAAKIQESLCQFRNMAGRQEIFEANGYTIIKDCYNAGPESMNAALNVLGAKQGRKVAVLGDMLELGFCTQAEHYRVGRIAAEKTDLILAYGPNSDRVISGAITGGKPSSMARAFSTQEELVSTLKRLAKPGDIILFKGSRGMHMELALEQFLQDER